MKKRLLAVILSMAMVICFVPMAVYATPVSTPAFKVSLEPQANSGTYFYDAEAKVTYDVKIINTTGEEVSLQNFDFGISFGSGIEYDSATPAANSGTVIAKDSQTKLVTFKHENALTGQTLADNAAYTVGTVTFKLDTKANLQALTSCISDGAYSVPTFTVGTNSANKVSQICAAGYQYGAAPTVNTPENVAKVKLNYTSDIPEALDDAYNGQTGTASVAVTGLTGDTDKKATYGTDVVLTVTPNSGYKVKEIKVKIGDGEFTALTANAQDNTKYTIPGNTITGNIEITGTTELDLDNAIKCNAIIEEVSGGGAYKFSYYSVASGTKSAVALNFSGNLAMKDGSPVIYKTSGYNGYTHVVLLDLSSLNPTGVNDFSALKEYLKKNLVISDTANKQLSYDYDVNGDEQFNFDDISVVYDFSARNISAFKWAPTDEQLLKADTDGSYNVVNTDVAKFITEYYTPAPV